MNYKTLENYSKNNSYSENYSNTENYSYKENVPRSTYELLLTPNGAVRQNLNENYIPPAYTHPQPYSYGFPYADYKYNEYSYFPKSTMSGVV